MSQFADSIVMDPRNAAMSLASAVVNNNVFNTGQVSPRGIWMKGAPTAPQVGYIGNLMVNGNLFGCGFCGTVCIPGRMPLPIAFVRPEGQANMGNIGVTTTCQ